MTHSSRVVLDACTLENFAVVERLDLLQKLFQGRGLWTAAVEREIVRGARERPHLAPLVSVEWLGEPIEFDDPLAIQSVDRIRRALGGSVVLSTQHLGEAQALYYVREVERGAVIATDDRSAYAVARMGGLRVVDTTDIVRECYNENLIGCPQAYRLLSNMAEAGRGIQMPSSHWYVCPQ